MIILATNSASGRISLARNQEAQYECSNCFDDCDSGIAYMFDIEMPLNPHPNFLSPQTTQGYEFENVVNKVVKSNCNSHTLMHKVS